MVLVDISRICVESTHICARLARCSKLDPRPHNLPRKSSQVRFTHDGISQASSRLDSSLTPSPPEADTHFEAAHRVRVVRGMKDESSPPPDGVHADTHRPIGRGISRLCIKLFLAREWGLSAQQEEYEGISGWCWVGS